MVRDSSLLAYLQLDYEGILSARQNQVYNYLLSVIDATDREIADALEFVDPNAVRPRRKELVDLGLVFECSKRECAISHKFVYAWSATPQTIMELIL